MVTKLLANPYTRLAARALLAGVVSAVVQLHSSSDGTLAWHAAVVAGALAFAEVFTPLNQLAGLWKKPA